MAALLGDEDLNVYVIFWMSDSVVINTKALHLFQPGVITNWGFTFSVGSILERLKTPLGGGTTNITRVGPRCTDMKRTRRLYP